MRNLVIMPAMANNRERMNLGEYAEEATIIMDEPVRPANHFIEANTQEATLHHLKHDCITPAVSYTHLDVYKRQGLRQGFYHAFPYSPSPN